MDSDFGLLGNNAASPITAAMTSGGLTVPVQELANYPDVGIIQIGTERILYTSKSASSGAGNLVVPSSPAGRGYDGSSAQAHVVGELAVLALTAYWGNRVVKELRAISDIIAGTTSLLHGLTIEAASGTEVPLTLLLHDEVNDDGTSKEKFLSFKRETGGVTSEVGSIVYDYANDQLEFHNFDVDVATGAFQVGGVSIFESDRDLAIPLIPNATRILNVGSATRYLDEVFAAKIHGAIDVRAYGAIGDGTTDDTAAIESAFAAAPAGSVVFFPWTAAGYRITDELDVTKSLTLRGDTTKITQATTGKRGFRVTASDVTVEGFHLVGAQNSATNTAENAIDVDGGTVGGELQRITVRKCRMQTWGGQAVYLRFVRTFHVVSNHVHDVRYAGIIGLSVGDGHVAGNSIFNITGASGAAYGITFTRNETSDTVANPRSTDITITGNVVRNVTNWVGIDTHGGSRIHIVGNDVYGCAEGIALTDSDDGSNVDFLAPQDCRVVGNVVDSGVAANASTQNGITLRGANGAGGVAGSYLELAFGCVISGNTVRGYGTVEVVSRGAISLRNTSGAVVSGNTVVEPAIAGIHFAQDNYGFLITGNAVLDPFNPGPTQTFAAAVNVSGDYNVGTISNNSWQRGAKVATYALTHGIRLGSGANNNIKIGPHTSDASTHLLDGSSRGFGMRFDRGMTFAGTTSDFQATPTFSTMTLGSVFFAGTGGLLAQDNANFFWDDTNNRLGLGTATPGTNAAAGSIGSGGKPRLHLFGTSLDQVLVLENTGNAVYNALHFIRESSAGVGRGGFTLRQKSDTAATAVKTELISHASSGYDSALNPNLALVSNGRVGVSLGAGVDPSYLLDVGGDVNVGGSGVLRVGGITLFENDRDLAVSLIPNAPGTLNLGGSAREYQSAWVLGGVRFSVASKSTDYTLTDSDTLVLMDATGGARVATLPTAVGRAGKVFIVKKTDSSGNTVTVDGDGAETIDGAATFLLTSQHESLTFVSDNANWRVI